MSSARTSLRATLEVPGIPVPVIGAFLARLSMGMTPLGTVLLVRAHHGSYAAAGACTASFAAATAIGSPIRGRLVDRRGHTGVLLVCGLLYSTGLALMVVAAVADAGTLALAGSLALAGLTYPPLSAALLGLWTTALVYPERIQTAYAFDAACAEGSFLIGNLLVALIAAQASANAAIVVAAGLGLIGTLMFAGSWRSRSWHPEPGPVTRTSAVRAPGVMSVVLHAAAVGAGIGALEIAVPAFAEAHDALDRSGLLLAVYSLGSVAGGFWLGTLAPAVGNRLVRRYLMLLVVAALAAGLLPAVHGLVELLPVLVLNGFFLAPIIATMYLLLERLAPVGNRTEAFSWLNTAVFSGAAVGSAVTGALTQGHGPTRAMLIVTGAAVVAATGAMVSRNTLRKAAARD